MTVDLTRYNVGGTVGLLVPQANPVAETELSVLLDSDVTMLVARMTDSSPSMAARLTGYTSGLEATIASFAGAPLDAIGFACTGSSYDDVAVSSVAEAGARATGSVFIAAADAVHAGFQDLQARRIALVSPYPTELTASAQAYWTRRGYQVTEVVSAPPAAGFHPIYGLTARALFDAMRGLGSDHDVVLLMGTGAPTLPAIAMGSAKPILSSNLCTGWRFAQVLSPSDGPSMREFAGPDAAWRARLAARYPSAMLMHKGA